MHRTIVVTAFVVTGLLTATLAQALTVGYGKRDITAAGPGCVGGWSSDHSNIAYYRGGSQLLNKQLAILATETVNSNGVRIVLHRGAKVVENPEEQPMTGVGRERSNPLAVDWSVRKTCPPTDVFTGRCQCNRRDVVVDVWISNQIRLREMSIPHDCSVESGEDFERFIESHRSRD